MAFADLKNDYIFRRIFATHPDILRRLLNDVLERRDAQTIEQIEYLPGEQLPVVEGAKLSILDVRCKDRAGTTFVVEMQLIHHPGFINRVVYNACKAYAGQLKEGDWYTKLTDVVAISICDFDLWPDKEQDKKGLARVPMLSRWNMTERASANQGLLQVQYAFLELPKMPDRRPEGPGADLWAWLFVHATELTEIPADLTPGPYGDALELANKAKFTVAELQAYALLLVGWHQVSTSAAVFAPKTLSIHPSKISASMHASMRARSASVSVIPARTKRRRSVSRLPSRLPSRFPSAQRASAISSTCRISSLAFSYAWSSATVNFALLASSSASP